MIHPVFLKISLYSKNKLSEIVSFFFIGGRFSNEVVIIHSVNIKIISYRECCVYKINVWSANGHIY